MAVWAVPCREQMEVTVEGEDYLILRESDILAVLG